MKSKLGSFLTMLALLAGVFPALAQVTKLGIAPAPGGQSVLYWPTSTTTNYILQTVTNLLSTNWVDVAPAIAVDTAEVTNAAPSGFFRVLPTTTPAGMAFVPAGRFTIGDTLDGDTNAVPTNVYVSAFVMDVNLVNYGLWTNVYAYATSNGYNFVDRGLNGGTATNYPVETVDWFDCLKWCNARSQQTSLTPVYYTDAGFTQVFTNGDTGTTVYQSLTVNGYRLPTEAEWEKAARGGLAGRRFPWGNFISSKQAQYVSVTGNNGFDLGPTFTPQVPSPVGAFDINGYGLQDMAGNLREWCWDGFASQPYPTGSPYLGGTNPTGPTTGTTNRVLRGGSWDTYAYDCRVARRVSNPPSTPAGNIGFRCVRGF